MAFQDLLFSVFVFSPFWFILGAAIAQTAWLKAVAVCLSQFYRESEIKVLTRLCFPEGLRGGSILATSGFWKHSLVWGKVPLVSVAAFMWLSSLHVCAHSSFLVCVFVFSSLLE